MEQLFDKNAVEIIKKLKDNGFRAYFGGGAVRDLLMEKNPADYDIATNASPEDVEKIFDRVVMVGKEFGVSNVIMENKVYEIARFRIDGTYFDGRRPENIIPSDEVGDVKRRDFTVNAMLYDPLDGVLLDFVGGENDIYKKIIKAVGDPIIRFSEDSLRMLRAVRLAVRLGFEIEEETFSAIKKLSPMINKISRERVGAELVKMFSGNDPDKALSLCDETGLLQQVLPEISALKGVKQSPVFHPEGDVFEHTKKMLQIFGGGSETLSFGILFHDCGKPSTADSDEGTHFYLHQETGAEITQKVLSRLRYSKSFISKVVFLVKNHMNLIEAKKMRKSTLRKIIALDQFEELLELYRLDCVASMGSREIYDYILDFCRRETNTSDGKKLPVKILNGDDLKKLGYKPGPAFKIILQSVQDALLDGEIDPNFGSAVEFVKQLFPPDG